MADISTELQAIMDAIYGEDVRSSIHDAIDLINKVGEVQLTLGTAVTSASSSVTGFYKDSVYYNTNTYDVWKCTGTAWALQGNLKGATGATGRGISSISKTSTSGLVDTYTITYTSGASTTFTVTNGYNPAVTITNITGGHQVKITDKDHPSGQTFNVMDGSNGAYFNGDALVLT